MSWAEVFTILGASIARFYSQDDAPMCAVSRQMRCLVHFDVHLQCLTPECIAWCSRCASEIACHVTHHKHEKTSWITYSGTVMPLQDDGMTTTYYAWHPQHDVILCKTCLSKKDSDCVDRRDIYDISDILEKWEQQEESPPSSVRDYW